MPPLVAFGRRWEFGSDDLVLPGLVVVGIRLLWFVTQVIGIAVLHNTLFCQHQEAFAAVAFISVTMTLFVLVVDCAIVVASAQGSILNTKRRRFVQPLVHFRLAVFLLEILALLVKTALASQRETPQDLALCSSLNVAVTLARVVVAVTWFIFLCLLVSFLVYLDPCHIYSAKVDFNVQLAVEGEEQKRQVWKLTHSLWEKRFRVMLCFTSSNETHRVAYHEVAEIFAHLFADTDLVLSDIAAGLVLLQKQHLYREAMIMNMADTERSWRSVGLDFENSLDYQIFKDSLHYMQFALGIYSWPLHVYMNICCGVCKLLRHMTCPCQSTTQAVGDNRCSCGFAGIVATSEINEVDIIYASLENDVYQAPFMVCLDHAGQSVVVAIRGSLSLYDVLTDLTAGTVNMTITGWPLFKVHKGMHRTAIWVCERLKNEDILAQAFRRTPQYNLVLVGHSLGAGCACLLSMMLREEYPDLRCFCYSPTGSLLSAEGAAYSQSFVTSITLGQDLITRLSVPTAHTLKLDVIHALETCRKPKYRILLEGGMETLSKCCGRAMVFQEDNLHSEIERAHLQSEVTDNEHVPLLSPTATESAVADISDEQDVDVPDATMAPLFPPGRIIHIVDTLKGGPWKRRLEACWASANSFNRVVACPDMISDHLPNVLLRAMEAVWEEKKDTSPQSI